jgi:Zn-dependent protease with chaperone function
MTPNRPFPFHLDAEVALPSLAGAGACTCVRQGRRRWLGGMAGVAFTGLLGAAGSSTAHAQGASIPECRRSRSTRFVPAEDIERAAAQQYRQVLQQAQQQRALAPPENEQLRRLRFIAQRMIPFAPACNERARQWRWEVNLIGSRDVNAFCMPGGKIAFFYGILAQLQLSDDEVGVIMGHEMAHALLEHAREQMAKNMGTNLLLRGGAAILGLGGLGDLAAQMGTELLSLRFSRDDESQADMLGLLVSAKAGYDPRAGVTLWRKMMQASGGSAPPAFMSTHPSSEARIAEIEGKLPQVMPMFEAAARPAQRFGPPAPLPPAAQRERR